MIYVSLQMAPILQPIQSLYGIFSLLTGLNSVLKMAYLKYSAGVTRLDEKLLKIFGGVSHLPQDIGHKEEKLAQSKILNCLSLMVTPVLYFR